MKRLLPLLILACFSLPVSAIEFRSINAATVLYDAPSARGGKLFVIKRDTPVEVVVSLEGLGPRCVMRRAVSLIDKKYLAEKRTLIVIADRAVVRQKAEDDSPLVFEAEKNVALEYVEPASGGWVKVRHRDGATGFVRANQVWGL